MATSVVVEGVNSALVSIDSWIGGEVRATTSGRWGTVWNPATGKPFAQVNFASAEDVDAAVAAAKAAFPAWRATSLSQRSEILFKLRALLEQNRERLAELLSTENGKTLGDARGEVARGLENIEFACGIPALLKGGYSEQASAGVDVYQIRQPLGVVAGITPFNFPAMVPLWMAANAIACGNAFICKPSEKDPSSAMFLADLWKRAGLPDGVFTVLHGDKEAVDALLVHPDVARTAAGLGEDGPAWTRLFGPLVRDADRIWPDVLGTMRRIPRHPLALARFGLPGLVPAERLARSLFRTA